MPPRHLSIDVKPVRRHEHNSFARQVAYISRATAYNPRTSQRHDFSRHGTVDAFGLSGWDGTIEELIDAVVTSERRDKAVEGRMVILALPHELTAEERLALVAWVVNYLIQAFKVAVCWAVHPPPEDGDQRNWHTHILITSREVVRGRALGRKTRQLDDYKTGGPLIEAFRACWCGAMNDVLRAAGHTANVEHKSFRRLGIEAEPSRHKGERRTAIERTALREAHGCRTASPRRNHGILALMEPELAPRVSVALRPLPVPNIPPAAQPGPTIDPSVGPAELPGNAPKRPPLPTPYVAFRAPDGPIHDASDTRNLLGAAQRPPLPTPRVGIIPGPSPS